MGPILNMDAQQLQSSRSLAHGLCGRRQVGLIFWFVYVLEIEDKLEGVVITKYTLSLSHCAETAKDDNNSAANL